MTQYVAYLRTVEKIAVQLVESRRQANIGQSGFEQSEQYRVFAAVDYLYSFADSNAVMRVSVKIEFPKSTIGVSSGK